MKVNKTISLDIEIAQRLNKEANGSFLINELLRENFKKDMLDGKSLPELREMLKKEKAIELAQAKLKEAQDAK
tara:strand:+ start:381 stop:599 length:219 start_codon:yes stop_codon:yes gene_type:complete